MFDLYFEKRLSAQEIKETLNLEISISTIQRTISSLIIATAKRKEKIKKANSYTYDDVVNYYKANKDHFDREQQEAYYKYFRKVDNSLSNKKEMVKSISIGPSIILDLVKDGNESAFSFENTPREETLNLLIKHKKELSDETISTLTRAYDIKGREYLSTKTQKKVLRLLAKVNIEEEYDQESPIMTLLDYDEVKRK